MFKACSKCGKIHSAKYKCKDIRIYQGGEERELRKTYAWQEKSKEIRDRANYLCEVCRDQGLYTYDNLEVHHIEKLKDRKDLLLENRNLVCLCSEHHKQADNGQLAKEYLRKLAEAREAK